MVPYAAAQEMANDLWIYLVAEAREVHGTPAKNEAKEGVPQSTAPRGASDVNKSDDTTAKVANDKGKGKSPRR